MRLIIRNGNVIIITIEMVLIIIFNIFINIMIIIKWFAKTRRVQLVPRVPVPGYRRVNEYGF
jgi:hypothetical protein